MWHLLLLLICLDQTPRGPTSEPCPICRQPLDRDRDTARLAPIVGDTAPLVVS